jgi:hypothetical protein
MMASYREPKNKTKSSTAGAAQQLERHPAEPEVKKPRVQLSEKDKSTEEEEEEEEKTAAA